MSPAPSTHVGICSPDGAWRWCRVGRWPRSRNMAEDTHKNLNSVSVHSFIHLRIVIKDSGVLHPKWTKGAASIRFSFRSGILHLNYPFLHPSLEATSSALRQPLPATPLHVMSFLCITCDSTAHPLSRAHRVHQALEQVRSFFIHT